MTLRGLVNPTSTRLQDGARCVGDARQRMRNARALFEASDKSQSLPLINRAQSLGNALRVENMPRLVWHSV